MARFLLLALCVAVAAVACCQAQTDPSYDHQTVDYNADTPVFGPWSGTLTVTPFFSPDHSCDSITGLIENAKTSVDIGTPSFGSWNRCGDGCPADKMRAETFPYFAALVNAIHRGVQVRILTNNYNTFPKTGLLDPLAYLKAAGAEVRYFTTVTFLHAKYTAADDDVVSVSSVNWDFTSVMMNREAGVQITGSSELKSFYTSVFESDWAQAIDWPMQTYNDSVMAIVNDPTLLPVVIPPNPNYPGAYITPNTTVTDSMEITATASPDNANPWVFESLRNAQRSLSVFIYQITTPDFCDMLVELKNKGVAVKLLVSKVIYDATDSKNAQICYQNLTAAGFSFRVTADKMYKYSHQKFWIIDDTTVFLSTGNWGSSDFPAPPMLFTAPKTAGWRQTNRDFNIQMTNPSIVQLFQNVIDQDYQRGTDYVPPSGGH